jgi:hypothetical protein
MDIRKDVESPGGAISGGVTDDSSAMRVRGITNPQRSPDAPIEVGRYLPCCCIETLGGSP